MCFVAAVVTHTNKQFPYPLSYAKLLASFAYSGQNFVKKIKLLFLEIFRLAEQRRKRVKELEEKISLLNKKVIDQDRTIKMKERNDEKIKTLNKEIMVCINLDFQFIYYVTTGKLTATTY